MKEHQDFEMSQSIKYDKNPPQINQMKSYIEQSNT